MAFLPQHAVNGSVGSPIQRRNKGSPYAATPSDHPETPHLRYAKPGRAAQACRKCRRLKMRCVMSADSSTCRRCERLGQVCEFRQDDQAKTTGTGHRRDRALSSPRLDDHNGNYANQASAVGTDNFGAFNPATSFPSNITFSLATSDNQLNAACGHHTLLHEERIISDAGDLPSIYSTSPVSAVVGNNDSYSHSNSMNEAMIQTPSMGGDLTESDARVNARSKTKAQLPLSRRDIREFIHIFRERIVHFIPVFCKEDFDAETLLDKHPNLAYCICYVTSFFLAGGTSTANALRGLVSEFVLEKCTNPIGTSAENLQDFCALLILYAYARPPPANTATCHPMPTSVLKALVEGHAINIGIHRSVEGVKADLISGRKDINKTIEYKKYIYWLWLYTMAHHTAILNSSPPSIRGDASIRIATSLLAGIDKSSRTSRILGEVELCLLWEKASTLDCRLSEWWCAPESLESLDCSPSAALEVAEMEIQAWCNKWNAFIARGGFGLGLDFHFRYARFCIISYTLRFVQGSAGNLSGSERESVKQCVQYALDIIEWALHLSPVSKDALRYMSDFGFVMIAFVALFVVQVHQHVKPVYSELKDVLDRVEALSELMADLAFSPNHCTALLARSLRRRALQIRQHELGESQGGNVQGGAHEPDLNSGPQVEEAETVPVIHVSRVEEALVSDGFLSDPSQWDPTAWLTEFLNDTTEWNVP
ncbi:hypothetical protein AYL99_09675 [Fonsecaea erecta]|uniref:Zn(2)-C6 fungal-type domain-containing protein n=1 Tax=Fonsecaea erecta TaxID=1367422 RepID=A0A178ZAK2_9EURO|nr:hypothetical protein AYL99_09675 [Fonsecaea erecta]OAP56496.1 hypothetical protein AYL99_09675 [Fonsecaea erecta]